VLPTNNPKGRGGRGKLHPSSSKLPPLPLPLYNGILGGEGRQLGGGGVGR